MAVLHELLAVEKTRTAAAVTLMGETAKKFNDQQPFKGSTRRLEMFGDTSTDPALAAEEAAAASEVKVTTTVYDTLEYALGVWATAEDVIFQKNLTNAAAKADIIFRNRVLVKDVPVDELLGLETRLDAWKKILEAMPTLDAKQGWSRDSQLPKYVWQSTTKVSNKTKKVPKPLILHPGDEHHPAQVKEVIEETNIGKYTDQNFSGAATARQMADVLLAVTDLITAVKEARMRANSTEVVQGKIGSILAEVLLQPLRE